MYSYRKLSCFLALYTVLAVVKTAWSWMPIAPSSSSSSSLLKNARLNPSSTIFPSRTSWARCTLLQSEKSSSNEISGSSSSSSSRNDEDSKAIERKSFDQAGASLIDEEDKEKMRQMGDYDSNPSYQNDSMERMREAIRARTAKLGLEKSQATADYIKARQEAAMRAGPPGLASNPDTFAGLDLSQISDTKTKGTEWNEEMPTMFYDPDEELTEEEMVEIDPIMKKSFWEQGLHELQNAKWPGPWAALREVALMLAVIALSCAIIISWDSLLRDFYTGFGFIPSKEELMNYASRFDGLDLPEGWTNNMNEDDIQSFAEKVNQNLPAELSGSVLNDALKATTNSKLPDL